MVLPIYATLEKMDETLLEAAADLGCPRWKAFWLVTLPLALPGVIAGALLCFIPIVGEFVIPDLLGGSEHADDRADAVDWNSSATATGRSRPRSRSCCSALLVVPLVIYQHLQARATGAGAADMRTRPVARSTSPRSRSGWRSSICRS